MNGLEMNNNVLQDEHDDTMRTSRDKYTQDTLSFLLYLTLIFKQLGSYSTEQWSHAFFFA